MRVIFLDRCRVEHIPFVGMVELKFPAHFPVDHLADPVVFPLVLLAAFVYYYYFTRWVFTPLLNGVFNWSLGDCNCPHISRCLLGILPDLIITVIWIVLISLCTWNQNSQHSLDNDCFPHVGPNGSSGCSWDSNWSFEFYIYLYVYWHFFLGRILCYILTLDRAVNQEMHLCK